MALGYQAYQPYDPSLYTLLLQNPTQPYQQSAEMAKYSFAKELLDLQDVLYTQTHDQDEVKAHLTRSVEKMLLTIKKSGITQYYQPAVDNNHVREDPTILRQKLLKAAKVILENCSLKPQLQQMDKINCIIDSADIFINITLQLTREVDFTSFIIRLLEYKMFWPRLKLQRIKAIEDNPNLKYQLESTSIFPLQYKIGLPGYNNHLANLLSQYHIQYNPEQPVQIEAIQYYLLQAIEKMKEQDQLTLEQITDILSKATKYKVTLINHGGCKKIDLLIPTLSAISCPTFVEAWSHAQPLFPLQINLMTQKHGLQQNLNLTKFPTPVNKKTEVRKPLASLQLVTPQNRRSTVFIDTPQEAAAATTGCIPKTKRGTLKPKKILASPVGYWVESGKPAYLTGGPHQEEEGDKENIYPPLPDLKSLVSQIIGPLHEEGFYLSDETDSLNFEPISTNINPDGYQMESSPTTAGGGPSTTAGAVETTLSLTTPCYEPVTPPEPPRQEPPRQEHQSDPLIGGNQFQDWMMGYLDTVRK